MAWLDHEVVDDDDVSIGAAKCVGRAVSWIATGFIDSAWVR